MAKMEPNSPGVISLSEEWIAAYKPPHWLTIPGRDAKGSAKVGTHPVMGKMVQGVLVDWLRERYGDVWTVHRLDLETSGVLLFARSAEAHKKANAWFEQRKMKKLYECLAVGVPGAPVMRISQPIEGAAAVTQVEVKESFQEGFLAQVRIHSGRRHQIRIHLAQQGFPVWGDTAYNGPRMIGFQDGALSINRVALHASKLELPTGEVFESYLPEDFEKWVERLRASGRRAQA